MRIIIKITFICVFSIILVGCTIETRPLEDLPIIEPVDNPDDPITSEIPKGPNEEEARKWLDEFKKQLGGDFLYNLATDYFDKTIENPIDYRKDIELNDKIKFGYMNKYIDDCNKLFSSDQDCIVVIIDTLSYTLNPRIKEWIKGTEYEEYRNRIIELHALEDQYYDLNADDLISDEELRQALLEIDLELRELNSIYGSYTRNLYDNWCFETFGLSRYNYDFYNNNMPCGIFTYSHFCYKTIDELNDNLETLNALAEEEWVDNICIIRNYGEFLSREELVSCGKLIASHEEFCEKQGIYYHPAFGPYTEDIEYYTYNIRFMENEDWIISLYKNINFLYY